MRLGLLMCCTPHLHLLPMQQLKEGSGGGVRRGADH